MLIPSNNAALNQVYRNHDAADEHGGKQRGPQGQPFLDDVARELPLAVEQESQQKKTHSTRDNRQKKEQNEIVARKSGRNGHDLIGDRRQALDHDDPGAPLRVSGAEGFDLIAVAVEMDQPGADRVIKQPPDPLADDAAGDGGTRARGGEPE